MNAPKPRPSWDCVNCGHAIYRTRTGKWLHRATLGDRCFRIVYTRGKTATPVEGRTH